MDDLDILIYCFVGAFFIAGLLIARMAYVRSISKQLDSQKIEPFNEADFVEVERPTTFTPTEPLRADAPVAPVFQISDDPLERFEQWAAAAGKGVRQNYYMSIMGEYGQTWKHPFLPEMKPNQYVRIIAPDEREARKIAHHYSGGYYATLHIQSHFLMVKEEYFPGGEYDHLDSESYWAFQTQNSI